MGEEIESTHARVYTMHSIQRYVESAVYTVYLHQIWRRREFNLLRP